MVSPLSPARKAEIIWVLNCVVNNFSTNSCTGIADIFASMFPGALPEQFPLGRTNFAYLLQFALDPYFHGQIVSNMEIPYFSIQYDETTNDEKRQRITSFGEVLVSDLPTVWYFVTWKHSSLGKQLPTS